MLFKKKYFVSFVGSTGSEVVQVGWSTVDSSGRIKTTEDLERLSEHLMKEKGYEKLTILSWRKM